MCFTFQQAELCFEIPFEKGNAIHIITRDMQKLGGRIFLHDTGGSQYFRIRASWNAINEIPFNLKG